MYLSEHDPGEDILHKRKILSKSMRAAASMSSVGCGQKKPAQVPVLQRLGTNREVIS